MNIEEQNNEYRQIVGNILNDKKFKILKDIEHHGVNRYDHSLKVSYYSYKVAKFLRLDYREVARAGLLHDFFISSNDRTFKERLISTLNHSKSAVDNSIKHFNVSEKEIDIIGSHMFPFSVSIPKYAESWIVNFVDKSVSFKEFSYKFGYRLNYVTNLMIVAIINYIR